MSLDRIIAEFCNKPLLLTQGHLESMLHVIGERGGLDITALTRSERVAQSGEMSISQDGIVTIPVFGTLNHRTVGLSPQSGLRSYMAIDADIETALGMDPRGIAFLVDSPGGAVSGAFDLRDRIMGLRGRVPTVAVASDTMGSAAYLIASAADRIYGTQTSEIGSIGAAIVHMDRSAQLKSEGVKPTFIFAGERKVDGNSMQPLTDTAREAMQDGVDEAYEMFVEAVAEARGISANSVKGTEARVFSVQNAIAMGLADEVGTLSVALESFGNRAPRSQPSMSIQGNSDMNEQELRAEGATSERDRIATILNSEAAATRPSMAKFMAFNKAMASVPADEIVAQLAAAPEESVQLSAEAGGEGGADELKALQDENAQLKAAAQSNLSEDGAGVDGDGGTAGADGNSVEARAAEAAKNAASFFKSRRKA